MLTLTIQSVILITFLVSMIYWIVPSKWVWLRRSIILVSSGLLIYVYNPRTLLLAILVVLWAYVIFHLARRFSGWRYAYILPILIIIPLVIDNIIPLAELLPFPMGSPRSVVVHNLLTLGLSYYTLKLYGSLKQGIKKNHVSFWDMLTTAIFYPSFSIGPIDFADAFSNKILSRSWSGKKYVLGIARIGIGIVKAFIIAVWIKTDLSTQILGADLGSQNWAELGANVAIPYIYLNFVNLYFNFSGFTDIAIGIGLLFNIDISENFHFPFLATSIQNFWQRWHLSLSNFITRYLFLPMVRSTGRATFSMIAAFVIIGMWHQVSVGYLIWGFGHGTALAMYSRFRGQARKTQKSVNYLNPLTILGIFATISFVALMSTIANQPNTETLIEFLQALVRIQ